MSEAKKIFLFIIFPLLIILGIIAYYIFGSNGSKSDDSSSNGSEVTKNNECPALVTPIDVMSVTAVLYPGQVRGGDYKPHGGFRMDNAMNNLVNVKAPLDAEVISASRYLEQGEVQYLFEFKTDCGLQFRFDHLQTLSTKLQAIAEKLPVAKVDDSRTTAVTGKISVTAGEIIATAVGIKKSLDASNRPNVGFDFGLYDTRQKNEASKNPKWVAAHQDDGDQAMYAVCWFDWLPASDAVILKALPGGDGQSGKMSDYCK
jgi:hypothetical protein